jgi:hypothetical protein
MTTTETTHRHHDAESKERQHKSTSIPFAIHELDDEDCLIIRLDR